MKRTEVIAFINDESPTGAKTILQQVAKEKWNDFMIVPARFESPKNGGEENDNDNYWQPMVIDRKSLTQHDSGGRMQCSRARIISISAVSLGVGYAYQSKKTGSWIWVG